MELQQLVSGLGYRLVRQRTGPDEQVVGLTQDQIPHRRQLVETQLKNGIHLLFGEHILAALDARLAPRKTGCVDSR